MNWHPLLDLLYKLEIYNYYKLPTKSIYKLWIELFITLYNKLITNGESVSSDCGRYQIQNLKTTRLD